MQECRELVRGLGKFKEEQVLPVDEEAREHMKSHELGEGDGDDGMGIEMKDKLEMREMERQMEGLGNSSAGKEREVEKVGLDECRFVLEGLLERCGLKGVLPERRI